MISHDAPTRARFKFRWLLDPRPRSIDWLDDEEWLPPGETRLYKWGKQGLKVVFETLGEDQTVLLPAYVPAGVTWAALNAGLDVRYYPISDDFTLPLEEIAHRIRTVEPAAIQVVHYFGFADARFDELVSIAHEHGALVIEDCARGLFGRDQDGSLLGSKGDFAVFCPHKTLPVPDGGIVVSRANASLPEVAPALDFRHEVRYLLASLRDRIPITVVPDNLIGQYDTGTYEEVSFENTVSGPSSLTIYGLARSDPADITAERRARYRALRWFLGGSDGFRVLSRAVGTEACPYGLVGIAASASLRDTLIEDLRADGLPCEALTWPPTYRKEAVSNFEGAAALRDRMVVFPTHQQLRWGTVGRMAEHITQF